ncbi:Luciferin 4-monooxygenase [Pseudolycoriella hygida]|uniref:Luciferin 4-monooxygenase n=1 Tax=Pseudolycoriella hygida TaxID=35572 RepID=A0A9Q0N0F8_9DIPT|nr:Luciferin 4-monooxygenase [Pseudolycoriella hygida]
MSSHYERVLYGGEVTDSLEKAKSLGEFCYNRLRKLGDRVLLVDGITFEEITASRLLSQSIRVAECLKSDGIKKGDHIGICCENRVEVPCVMFGIFFIGATYVPLSPSYTERELLHACNLSKPRILFTSYQTVNKFKQFTQRKQFIEKIFIFGNECVDDQSFNLFLQNRNVPSNRRFFCPPQNMMENIALVFCSSGTTGDPKGVQLSQYSTWFSVMINVLKPMANDCRLTVTPWTHVFGCFSVVRAVLQGIKMVSLSRFDETIYLSCIERFKVTTLMVVPPLIVLLSKCERVHEYDTSSLKYAVSTAAPLSKQIVRGLESHLPHLKVRQYYGMSEGSIFISQTDTFCSPGSVGALRSGVYGKVVDLKSGAAVGPNIPGELLFKSPGIMKGYIGDCKSTEIIFDNDGWLHTGDIGYYDEKGEWFIVDRLKELIKYKGYQVPPAELEALILSHPYVKDVGVVGIPDNSAGELPMAFVVKHGNCTEKDIKEFVASQSSHAKRLYGGVRFVSEIPKNPSDIIPQTIE